MSIVWHVPRGIRRKSQLFCMLYMRCTAFPIEVSHFVPSISCIHGKYKNIYYVGHNITVARVYATYSVCLCTKEKLLAKLLYGFEINRKSLLDRRKLKVANFNDLLVLCLEFDLPTSV
jgi:hypothetical protein